MAAPPPPPPIHPFEYIIPADKKPGQKVKILLPNLKVQLRIPPGYYAGSSLFLNPATGRPLLKLGFKKLNKNSDRKKKIKKFRKEVESQNESIISYKEEKSPPAAKPAPARPISSARPKSAAPKQGNNLKKAAPASGSNPLTKWLSSNDVETSTVVDTSSLPQTTNVRKATTSSAVTTQAKPKPKPQPQAAKPVQKKSGNNFDNWIKQPKDEEEEIPVHKPAAVIKSKPAPQKKSFNGLADWLSQNGEADDTEEPIEELPREKKAPVKAAPKPQPKPKPAAKPVPVASPAPVQKKAVPQQDARKNSANPLTGWLSQNGLPEETVVEVEELAREEASNLPEPVETKPDLSNFITSTPEEAKFGEAWSDDGRSGGNRTQQISDDEPEDYQEAEEEPEVDYHEQVEEEEPVDDLVAAVSSDEEIMEEPEAPPSPVPAPVKKVSGGGGVNPLTKWLSQNVQDDAVETLDRYDG